MARSPDRNTRKSKDETGKHDDAYFARQWEEMKEAEAEREKARQRYWFERLRKEEQRARYTPWLVIPAALTDYGARPLAASLPHWQSPFIGVLSPDPSGIALAGAPNTVWARVFNLGAATSAPTRVRFYWADPSVGLGAADAHFIGEAMVEVPTMRSVVVNCPEPWVPTYLNNGHECLFVSAENQIFDPMTAPFEPRQDRHVGQRNIQVLPSLAQAMNLWLPGGAGIMAAELRVLALEVRARDLPLRATPVETLAQVADQVLTGFAPSRRERRGTPRPRLAVKPIDPDRVIEDLGLTGETRNAGDAPLAPGAEPVERPDRWGRRLLRIKTEPGLHQQAKIAFRELDLRRDTLMLLHFTWLAEGRLIGGYTVTLASPGWFEPEYWKPKQRGGLMATSEEKRTDLRDLVIRHNPQAEATYEIARQLEGRLPIRSAKDLPERLKLGEAYLSAERAGEMLGALFPIETAEDLVKRTGAVLRAFASHAAANRASLSSGEMLLLDRLNGAGDRPVRQVLMAQGEPIFPLPPEEKE